MSKGWENYEHQADGLPPPPLTRSVGTATTESGQANCRPLTIPQRCRINDGFTILESGLPVEPRRCGPDLPGYRSNGGFLRGPGYSRTGVPRRTALRGGCRGQSHKPDRGG